LRAAPLVLVALWLAAAAPAGAQPGSFAIERFAATIEVGADSSLAVREAITFRFRGRHQGIYRVIPLHSRVGGLDRALRLDGVAVFDESLRPLRTEVTDSGGSVRIKAWVPDAVDAARTVIVAYRVRRALFPVDDHAELYWNVTGDQWDAPIREAEAVVVAPRGVTAAALQSIAYTGPRGAAGTAYAEERVERFLTVRTTRPLGPREGLTIAVALPAGAVAAPSRWREAAWQVEDNWPLALPLLAAALGGLAWWRWGRDPAVRRSIKPEYAPPDGLAPALAGALLDERAEPRDVIATLVDLAVRGYLRIEQVTRADGEPDFMFRRLKPILGDPDIRPFELVVLAMLFDSDWRLNMRLLSEARRDYDTVFPPIRDEIYRSMVRERLFPASPGGVRRLWVGAGWAIAAVGGTILLKTPGWVPGLDLALGVGVTLSGLVVVALSPLMPKRTVRGAEVLVRVRGFQEFLERAEKDRLERLPRDTLHRWLPWAMALGVTERWIFNWDGIAVDRPSWFGEDGPFSLSDYHRAVDSFGRRTEEAILTSRRGAAGGWSGTSGMSGGASGRGMGGGGGGTF